MTKSNLLCKINIIKKVQKKYKKSVDKVGWVWYHNQVACKMSDTWSLKNEQHN